jgi:serine/threonine protein kinase
MGIVHLGSLVSPAGERLVAIKQLVKKGGVDDAARERLVAEAKLVFQLTHANICQVLDLGENERGTFVVMEYVRGCDLRALLAQLEADGKALDEAMVAHIGREVARALDYAHRRVDVSGRPLGVVHGDVTPQNILLSIEGEVKLADFGIARAIGPHAPGAELVAGTPGFMAPEAHAGTIDHRADIWSLGTTIHRALTGAMPGPGGPDRDALETRGVAADLKEIVLRAIADEPGARHLSAAEVERELSAWLARRHPEFTPSALARVVMGHARAMDVTSPRTAVRDDDELLAIQTLLQRQWHDRTPQPKPPPKPSTATALPVPRSWRAPLFGALIALAVAGGTVAWFFWGGQQNRTEAAMVNPPPETPPAPAPAPEPAPPAPKPPDPEVPERARKRRPDEPGFITVNSSPWGAVYIDGKKVASETPLYRHSLKPGRHAVLIKWGDTGRRSEAKKIVLEPGEHETLGFRK